MTAVDVSHAGSAASDVLAEIHADCFNKPWSATEFAGLLAQTAVRGLIGRIDGDPAGMALLRTVADEAEILTIGVRPECRAQGVGQALLDALEQEAAGRGVGRVFLEVSDSNTPARHLYDQAGYSEIGLRRGYYADGSDARILEKQL